MKNILLILLSFSFTQVAKYEYPYFLNNQLQFDSIVDSENLIKDYTNIDLIENGKHFIIENKIVILYNIKLDNNTLYNCSINFNNSTNSTKVFLLDNNSSSFIGPLYTHNNKIEEKISSSDFIIEVSMDIKDFYTSQVILESISVYKHNSGINRLINNVRPVSRNRENPVILVTGFWPPTNEMIRHFSQSIELNPDGWEGDDWEQRGYDIISYFPEFSNPNCSNCGIGYGDFEVDYQDTSNDFWPIVDELEPIAVITFSRGFINQSWEMEYNFYNRTNWYPDYATPTLPTPNPPDEGVDSYFQRNSTLPMEGIMNAVNNSNLGLDSYIDWDGDPGHFVSEFMGYHGVWYHDTNLESCITAGHIHVGGTIDWDTAKSAAEISIRETINYLDQFNFIPGDVNDDAVIDILDLVVVVNVILGQSELSNLETYAADMNLDGTINIQDIILIINLILS